MTKFTLHIETDDAAVVERIGRAMNSDRIDITTDADPRGEWFKRETPGHNPAADPAKVEVSDWKGPEHVSAGNGSGGDWSAEQAFTRGGDPAPTATEQGDSGSDTGEPAPTVTEPANTGQSVELDADGLPWDERIHASTKTKKQDGRWKAKRGVNPDTVKQVEAELRGVMGHDEPSQALTPPLVAPPAPPAPEAGADSDAPTDFMGVVQAAGRHGWTPDQIGAALQKCNPPLPSFQQLANRPDLIPQFWAAIQGG